MFNRLCHTVSFIVQGMDDQVLKSAIKLLNKWSHVSLLQARIEKGPRDSDTQYRLQASGVSTDYSGVDGSFN